MTIVTSMLDEALAYAARGWWVVALHAPQSDGSCSCGKSTCDSIGKHPRWDAQLLPNGLKSATTNPGIIQIWWALWPDANIGVVTGPGSDFWALDIDPQHGGDLSLEQLIAQQSALPETVEAITGGGGSHLLFRRPASGVRNRVKFAPGLDTRGDGGYIVVAPSLHASGQRYQWRIAPDDAPLVDAPQWLLDLICPPARTPAPAAAQAAMNGHHATLPKRTLIYIVFGAQKGDRNNELYHAAQQCYAAGYSQAEADQLLRPRARQDGLADREIDKTIVSAYQSLHVSGPAAAPGTPPAAPQQPASSSAGAGTTTSRRHSSFITQTLAGLGYSFRLNLCTSTIEVNGMAIDDFLRARIRMDARDAGLRGLDAVEDAYAVDAANNAYHPIRDYLNGLTWDGQLHIAKLARYFTCLDPLVVYRNGTTRTLMHVYLWRWLIGAVAKVMTGAQNMMLVLAGPQRIGKSQFAKWLCKSLLDYFIEAPIVTGDKDTYVRLISKFIWEVSELDATTRKADVSALKAFITEEQVTVRKAYARHDLVRPALASLIGTVNESTGFLNDDTGNQRFFVTTISAIDWAYTTMDIDQVWAEAVAAYQRGDSWRLTAEEAAHQAQQNKQHETETILEDLIQAYFDLDYTATNTRMTAGEIVEHLRTRYDIRLSGTERKQAMDLAAVLNRLGVRKIRTSAYRGYEGIAPK